MPYAVSFDDDSYPIDADFFAIVEALFTRQPDAAVLSATIQHRGSMQIERGETFRQVPNYIGCGHAIRSDAYRRIRGYLALPIAYEMEEADVSLQLFAAGWKIYETRLLRVFHDTNLTHHQSPEITAAVIRNVGLNAFLNYPLVLWPWGIVQIVKKISYCIGMGRLRGIMVGLIELPKDCFINRKSRRPLPYKSVLDYLCFRRVDMRRYRKMEN